MSSAHFISFSPPLIGQEEIDEVIDTLRSDWITTGPKTRQFESDFAAYLHAPGALALNSCTAGLHTALAALNIGPGDEVITTTMTFCATANVIEEVGARTVLVDVEADTLNMDPARVGAAITARTRAIMPVHFAGHPVDMDPIRALAAAHDLQIVEDAAHSLPATYKGRLIGSWDNPAAYSFYATKNLTTGEGGMLTGTQEFLDRARILMLHGMSRDAWKRYEKNGSWFYEVVTPGFKYNMSDIQASLGIWQLRKLAAYQQRRRQVVDAYSHAFSEVEALETPVERAEVTSAWHLYVLRLHPECLTIDRNRFIEEMTARNIGTSVHFIPIHLHPYYREKYGYAPDAYPVAYANYQRTLSLPLNPRMSDDDVAAVIEAVLDIVKTYRR